MSTIYIFGDSIAAGQGCDEGKSWPTLLQNSLKDTKIINGSFGGDTTADILQRFEVKNPDLIIFAVGMNDSSDFEGEKRVSLADFEKNIKKLIGLCGKTKMAFVGLTCADENKTITPIEEYRNKEIEKYNEKLKEICKQHKILFINIFDRWIKRNYKKLLDDGLHPNVEGHKLLAEQIAETLISSDLLQ